MTKAEIIDTLKDIDGNLTETINASNSFLFSHGEKTLNIKSINGRTTFYSRTKSGTQVCVNSGNEKEIKALCTAYYAKKIRSAAVKEKVPQAVPIDQNALKSPAGFGAKPSVPARLSKEKPLQTGSRPYDARLRA